MSQTEHVTRCHRVHSTASLLPRSLVIRCHSAQQGADVGAAKALRWPATTFRFNSASPVAISRSFRGLRASSRRTAPELS